MMLQAGNLDAFYTSMSDAQRRAAVAEVREQIARLQSLVDRVLDVAHTFAIPSSGYQIC